MLIKHTKEMTERERIAVENSNNQYLEALAYVAVGTIFPYAGAAIPDTFMLCDGSLLDTTEYAQLFESIGYTYGGEGDSFKIPDLRETDSVNYIIKTNQNIPNMDLLVPEWVKVLLEGGTEWVFDGGDSSSEIDIEFVVDEAPSTESNNPVSNSAITKYVKDRTIDYFIEHGNTEDGIYSKRNSGVVEFWKRVEVSNITRNTNINGTYYTPEIALGNFPAGLFIDKPYICDISLQNPEFSSLIETGSKPTTKDTIGSVYLASTVSKESMYATICIYAMGYWK